VSCPSLVVPKGGSLTCTYSGSLSSGASTVNVATAAQQNFHYAADGSATATGTTSYSGSAPVVFGVPTALIDTCAAIADAFNGAAPAALGNLCATSLSWSTKLSYTASFTWDPSLGTCKTIALANVASFTTADTHGTGSSSATINVTNQDCVLGCTLTQGYWKNHSKYGPAKSDPVWNQILPSGPDSPFFASGLSWLAQFRQAPAGNPYWVLSHQYAAAVLNGFGGASAPPQVQTALSTAYGLFNDPKNTPAYVAGLKNSSPIRSEFISLAALLDMYNNGQYPGGPAHCTEDSSSGQ
jgi:hypothetical protein